MITYERNKITGFTLIELSIALVIIGLLLAGVLVGKDMIRAAEMRKTIAHIESISQAINIFKDKYKAIPGDWSKATQFFGALDPVHVDCADTTPSLTATCNGNGDFRLAFPEETNQFWHHLYLTGYEFVRIDQPFRACFSSSCTLKLILPNSYMKYFHLPHGHITTLDNLNGAVIGGFTDSAGDPAEEDGIPLGDVILPIDAYNIDLKLDDGKPSTGIIVTIDNFSPNDCRNGATPPEYDAGNANNPCALFLQGRF